MDIRQSDLNLFGKFISEEIKKNSLQDTKDGVKDTPMPKGMKKVGEPVAEDPEEIKDPGAKNERKVNEKTKEEIIQGIMDGTDEYFGYAHFDASNMADYTLMSTTIEDIVNVYGIEPSEAADIVQALTHGKHMSDSDDEETYESIAHKDKPTIMEDAVSYNDLHKTISDSVVSEGDELSDYNTKFEEICRKSGYEPEVGGGSALVLFVTTPKGELVFGTVNGPLGYDLVTKGNQEVIESGEMEEDFDDVSVEKASKFIKDTIDKYHSDSSAKESKIKESGTGSEESFKKLYGEEYVEWLAEQEDSIGGYAVAPSEGNSCDWCEELGVKNVPAVWELIDYEGGPWMALCDKHLEEFRENPSNNPMSSDFKAKESKVKEGRDYVEVDKQKFIAIVKAQKGEVVSASDEKYFGKSAEEVAKDMTKFEEVEGNEGYRAMVASDPDDGFVEFELPRKKTSEKKLPPKPKVGDQVETVDMSRLFGTITKIVDDNQVEVKWTTDSGDRFDTQIEDIKDLALVKRANESEGDQKSTIKDIYPEMKKTGLPMDNHESDLYVKVDPKSTEIIKRYEHKGNVSQFKNNKDGSMWYDIPFAYTPWWDKKLTNATGGRRTKIDQSEKKEVKESDQDLPFDQSGKMVGWIALYKGKEVEILKSEADSLWKAKELAAKKLNVPKSGMGLLAIAPAYESKIKDGKLPNMKKKPEDGIKKMTEKDYALFNTKTMEFVKCKEGLLQVFSTEEEAKKAIGENKDIEVYPVDKDPKTLNVVYTKEGKAQIEKIS
jgi:hypothetical protein